MQKNISTKFDVLRTVDMADIMIPNDKVRFYYGGRKENPIKYD